MSMTAGIHNLNLVIFMPCKANICLWVEHHFLSQDPFKGKLLNIHGLCFELCQGSSHINDKTYLR